MKTIVNFFPFLLIGILFNLSCQKKLLCPDCDTNKPPIANAGTDQTITLPKDSIMLDGSASSDADGTITFYKWVKISGPTSSNIATPDSSKTKVKNLVMGVYKFELMVKDNRGLSAKDTVQIMVDNPGVNQPPIACAGPDQVISLPTNTVNLDGSCSADPDNNITAYTWTKISGPTSYNISNANAVQTQITNLVEGIYKFELKVTDAGVLFSKDTLQVTVNSITNTNSCGTNRPIVNAQLIPFGLLSQARFWMGVASAGNKIVFAGGYTDGNLTPSSRVDIYDINTQSWLTAELSLARAKINAVAVGNKIFFAGGEYYDSSDHSFNNPHAVNVMDIYDVFSNTWSVVSLIGGRAYTASAAVGNKLFFVNGSEVDIYDISAQKWSTKSLSDGRSEPSVVAANNKVYFAGGMIIQGSNIYGSIVIPKNTIDIYDNATNTWSVSTLAEGKLYSPGIAVAGKVYFAGGYNSNTNSPPFTTSCIVDIIDANTENKSVQYLSRQWQFPGRLTVKNNKIVFLNGTATNLNNTEIDIYDITTNTWSIGKLPLQNISIWGTSIISINNTIYIAGTYLYSNPSHQMYKLEF